MFLSYGRSGSVHMSGARKPWRGRSVFDVCVGKAGHEKRWPTPLRARCFLESVNAARSRLVAFVLKHAVQGIAHDKLVVDDEDLAVECFCHTDAPESWGCSDAAGAPSSGRRITNSA